MAPPVLNNPTRPRIIIVDSSPSVRYTVGLVLGERCEVEGYGEAGEVLGRVGRGGVDLVILGLDLPFSKYLPFLQGMRRRSPFLPVLFLSTKEGGGEIGYLASDVLRKPFFPGDLQEKVERLLVLGKGEEKGGVFCSIVSPLEERVSRWVESRRVSAEVRERVRGLSSFPVSILIEGEEGTGKRWVARGLHYLGGWKGSEIVYFSGKGLEREGLVEELRGRVRGRERCGGLDIYIEGVEDLSWEMQGYLVRNVEEGWSGEDLGFGVEVPVRVLGSSGEGMGELVRRGEVRRDFGEYMWGERIWLEALRERVGEIGGLVEEVLRERGIGKRVSVGAVGELQGYEWPGNVEELEGLVLRTGLMVKGEEIGKGDWVWGFERRGEKAKRGKGEEGIERKGEEIIGEEGKRDRREEEKGERSVESVEALLSTLVHEVKNPLVAISTFAHLLPERYGEEDFRGEFSRLVGIEVRRLNGVLEMLLEYGQLGVPQPAPLDLGEWLKKYAEDKRQASNQGIVIELKDPLMPVLFDERHLFFVLERIFDRIQSKGVVGGEIRIGNGKVTPEENWEKIEIDYDEQESATPLPLPGKQVSGEGDFESLSLWLGLARRIMKKNCGEMSVLQEPRGKTRILLRLPGRALTRSEH